jgi:hypothetical protein
MKISEFYGTMYNNIINNARIWYRHVLRFTQHKKKGHSKATKDITTSRYQEQSELARKCMGKIVGR